MRSPHALSNTEFDACPWLGATLAGTELELQWGKSLQAALAHKLQDSDIGTEATLTYKISNYLRLQLQLTRLSKPSLLLQYSSEGKGPG